MPYTLRRSRRARRLLLHVDISGEIELVVPWRASYIEGRRFIAQKRTWIRKQRASQAARRGEIPKRELISGTLLPCFGSHIRLEVRKDNYSRTVSAGSRLIVVTQDTSRVRPLIEKWYRRQARIFFEQEVRTLVDNSTSNPITVRITGARTLWGSCSPNRRAVSFTWRLALAPADVARYVAAHEVAHFQHAKHSESFWNVVAQLHPDHAESRKFLRTYGHTLEL